MKPKLLIFHPALAPYRVDQFNFLGQIFDVTIVFLFDNVWNHPFDQKMLLADLKVRYRFLLKGPFYKGRVFRWGMLRVIREVQPDFVLGYEFSFTTLFLILLKKLGVLRQPIGSTIDDSPEICRQIQSRGRYVVRSAAVKHLDYLVVLSEAVASYYRETFRRPASSVIVSPILQNPDHLRSQPRLEVLARKYAQTYGLNGKKVILFVGRFIPEKGLHRFVQNLSGYLKEHPDLRLVLVGDGLERPNLESLVSEQGLQKSVLLPGRFEGPELHAWYLCASGFVLPSIYEPFGAVVNEALIFGVRVLCSQYAGSLMLLTDATGTSFDPLDATRVPSVFSRFATNLAPLEHVELARKPPLVEFDASFYEAQWSKMSHD